METLACGDAFVEFARTDNFIALVAITMGCFVGICAIIGGSISGVMRTRAKEMTKRELAAYVAEGSLDPDKAVQILNSGGSRRGIELGKHV